MTGKGGAVPAARALVVLRACAGAIALLSLPGCLTLPSAQTARTLAPGAEGYGVTVGAVTLARDLAPEWLAVAARQGLPVDFAHAYFWFRRGFSDRMDAGFHTLSFLAYGADLKWMVHDGPRVSLATGFGMDLLLPVILPYSYGEAAIPVYVTYRPAPRLSLTLAVRATLEMETAKTLAGRRGGYLTEADPVAGMNATATTIVSFRKFDLVVEGGITRFGFVWSGVGISLTRAARRT